MSCKKLDQNKSSFYFLQGEQDPYHVLLKKTCGNVLPLQWTDIFTPPVQPGWMSLHLNPMIISGAFKDSIHVGFSTCKSTEDEPPDHVQEVTALYAQKNLHCKVNGFLMHLLYYKPPIFHVLWLTCSTIIHHWLKHLRRDESVKVKGFTKSQI